MTVFIALLRGINVGKAKRVPMAELRVILSELGHTDVATLLNSGNAVFRAASGTPASHAAAISAALAARLALQVPVVVKTASVLQAIAAGNPLADGKYDPSRLVVAFAADVACLQTLSDTITPKLQPGEAWVRGPLAGYLHCPQGLLQSRAAAALLGQAGREVTCRNWATVRKLQALANSLGKPPPAA